MNRQGLAQASQQDGCVQIESCEIARHVKLLTAVHSYCTAESYCAGMDAIFRQQRSFSFEED